MRSAASRSSTGFLALRDASIARSVSPSSGPLSVSPAPRPEIPHSIITYSHAQHIREYVTPVNLKTELQEQHRAIFNDAVKTWHGLSPRQREFYNRIADGMTGYNLFISRYVGSVRNGFAPESPVLMQWVTEDGQPLEQCWLIVRQRTRELFVDNLKDAKGEVALTPSDTPYTFVLRRGTQEDTVLTVEDLLEQEIPMVWRARPSGSSWSRASSRQGRPSRTRSESRRKRGGLLARLPFFVSTARLEVLT